jgi:Ser/Thr protein kinase RdoA (MazF antagonist)
MWCASELTGDDLRPWSGEVRLGPAVAGGTRAVVRRASVDGVPVVVRRSRRAPEALAWELDLLDALAADGFVVPTAVPTSSGVRHVGGVVVSRCVGGRPPAGDDDWHAVADELHRLHEVTAEWSQRPGFCSAHDLLTEQHGGDVDLSAMPPSAVGMVRAAWAALPDATMAVVHGDTNAANVRIGDDGRVALLHWDEARVDCPWFDLADLPVRRLPCAVAGAASAAAHAWETANCWVREPAYARWRLGLLDGFRSVR